MAYAHVYPTATGGFEVGDTYTYLNHAVCDYVNQSGGSLGIINFPSGAYRYKDLISRTAVLFYGFVWQPLNLTKEQKHVA